MFEWTSSLICKLDLEALSESCCLCFRGSVHLSGQSLLEPLKMPQSLPWLPGVGQSCEQTTDCLFIERINLEQPPVPRHCLLILAMSKVDDGQLHAGMAPHSLRVLQNRRCPAVIPVLDQWLTSVQCGSRPELSWIAVRLAHYSVHLLEVKLPRICGIESDPPVIGQHRGKLSTEREPQSMDQDAQVAGGGFWIGIRPQEVHQIVVASGLKTPAESLDIIRAERDAR